MTGERWIGPHAPKAAPPATAVVRWAANGVEAYAPTRPEDHATLRDSLVAFLAARLTADRDSPQAVERHVREFEAQAGEQGWAVETTLVSGDDGLEQATVSAPATWAWHVAWHARGGERYYHPPALRRPSAAPESRVRI